MIKMNIKRIVLLIMALTLMCSGSTFSWIEELQQGGYISVNNVYISSSGNLTMKQDGEAVDMINVPNFQLEEVSSADGRNYYFPMTNNTSNEIGNMTFREGIPADKNLRYVSVDFTLEAGEGVTEVYLGAGTLVQCSNVKLQDILRMSLYLNDGSDPIVFTPSQKPGTDVGYSPITSINDEGAAEATSIKTKSCGDYYYKGEGYSTPVFSFENGNILNVTLAVWLEGTSFSGDDIPATDINIFFDFATDDNVIKYTFEDDCHTLEDAKDNRWVANNVKYNNVEYATMMYMFDTATQRYYSMIKIKDTNRWEGYLPETVTDFYFRRYTIDTDTWWNQWEPDMENIPVVDGERTYVAVYGVQDVQDTSHDGGYGYWKDAADTIRVFFRLEENWDVVNCYASGDDSQFPLGPWPGVEMNFLRYDGDSSSSDYAVSKPVYYIDIENSSILKTIEFNNSVDTNDNGDEKYEISDLKHFFNGLYAWFENHSTYGKTIYMDEQESTIYPHNDPTP